MNKKKLLLYLLFLYAPLFSASSYITYYLYAPNIQFNEQTFNSLLETGQLQTLRNYFYSLPLKSHIDQPKETAEWMSQLKWLKTAAKKNPSLAYIAARTLQLRGFSSCRFYAHLALLYSYLCSVQCQNQELLQTNTPYLLLKKQIEYHELYDCKNKCNNSCKYNCKKCIFEKILKWKKSFNEWKKMPHPFWISCIQHDGSKSISYTPLEKEVEQSFLSKETDAELINALCEKAFQTYIKKNYPSK